MEVIDLNQKQIQTKEELPHFKVKKLQVNTEKNNLNFKINSPYFKKDNYSVNATNGLLTISVMIKQLNPSPNGKIAFKHQFLRAFFTIPLSDFNRITSVDFDNGNLFINLKRDNTITMNKMSFTEQLATA